MKTNHPPRSRKVFAGTLILLVACLFTASSCKKEPTASGGRLGSQKFAGVVELGAILPMTGDAAKYGKWGAQGIELAVEEVNSAGGINGKRLDVKIEDSRTNPTEAVTAANLMISQDKPKVILTTLTGVVNALVPITERNKIILFANATLPGLTEKGRLVFRNVANLASDIAQATQFCAGKLDKPSVAVIWRNDEFGVWGNEAFRKSYSGYGGSIVASEGYDPGRDDFRTQLTHIVGQRPRLIYILGYSESGKIMKQARELGFKGTFMGITTIGDPEVRRIAGNAAEGAYFTESAFNPDNPELADFQKKYQAKFGEKVEVWGATFYDAVKILQIALQKDTANEDVIRENLLAIKDFPGISGKTSFLPSGDVLKPVNVKVIKNGAIEIVK